MKQLYCATVSALCYTLLEEGRSGGGQRRARELNETVRFVLEQSGRMPDFLRVPFRILTVAFNIQAFMKTGVLFHRQEPELRAVHAAAWKHSRISVRRDFIRYYESLGTLFWHAKTVPLERSAGEKHGTGH